MSNSDTQKIVNESAPFLFEELFFSRTDSRGMILSGNSVFQKISQYSWEELLNKPHNIIRHPEMPKAVFWLLWDTIKKGNPIGAYVNNRTKDGKYYWVFAIVTPVEGGYLSVRLKPSSQIFSTIQHEYQQLTTLERKEKTAPEKSAKLLFSRLAELGFSQYHHFMATALSAEIKERDKQLGKKEDPAIAKFGQLVHEAHILLQEADKICTAYENSKHVPLNLRIHAAQIGDAGCTIGVIASNYNIISSEIKTNLNQFMALAHNVFDTINEGLFLTCTARIQREVLEIFQSEKCEGAIHKDQEMKYLQYQQNTYQEKALEGLKQITTQIRNFHQSFLEMKKLSTGLEVTRIMGKVESARVTSSQDSLAGLIDDLEIFQNSVSASLKEIDNMNRNIKHNVETLLKSGNIR